MDCSMPGLSVPQDLLKFAQVHVHCISDVIHPSHPLMALLLLPSILPSIRDIFNESTLYLRWPKIWSFSFSISPSNQYSGLISLKIDWFDLPTVQGDLGSQESSPAPQFKGINSLAFCLPYGPALTTVHCEIIASQLERWPQWEDYSLHYMDLCRRVMSLVFNALSRFVIAFLTRSKCLGISQLQSSSGMILEPKKRKSSLLTPFPPLFAMK